jgi:hypothetical protein
MVALTLDDSERAVELALPALKTPPCEPFRAKDSRDWKTAPEFFRWLEKKFPPLGKPGRHSVSAGRLECIEKNPLRTDTHLRRDRHDRWKAKSRARRRFDLLQVPAGTQLYDRMEKEGRLFRSFRG